jgi:hypothetical protein
VDSTLDLELKQPGRPGRPAETNVADILEILGEQSISVGDWGLQCCAELGISNRTFKELKAVALKKGLIIQTRDGRKEIVSARGQFDSCTNKPAEQAAFKGLGQ